jgi:integrase
MAAGNVTITAVEALREGWLWDAGHRSAVVGFGARRQRDGVFYYLRYRLSGRQRMLSIGRHGSPWTPELARRKAKELLGLVAASEDPAHAAQGSTTFATEVERYLTLREDTARPKTHTELTRHLCVNAKPLAGLALSDVTRRAVAECLASASGAATRNRVRSSLSAFFTWAIAEGLLPDDAVNPVTGTATADEGGSRDRVLTDDELRIVWRSLRDDPYGDIVRLLILTACRREEIGGLMWSEVEAGAIRLPPKRVKNGREHLLPLSPQAAAILRRRAAKCILANPVLGSHVFGSGGPYRTWSNPKAALDARIAAQAGAVQLLQGTAQAASIPRWTLHDLRRTAATGMADKLGVMPHVVEAILNHISGHKAGVAGVYNLARYEAEAREALQRWADYIDALASGE